MRFHYGIGLFTLTLVGLALPRAAQAANASCMSPDGACEVSNDFGDSVSCMCADGSGGGGVGGNEWAGLSDMELEPICDEQLALFCGPPPPPEGIPCSDATGSCWVDNDPFDSVFCECADGSAGGGGGGVMWAGLSDMELLGVCEDELALFCGGAPPPPPGIECGTPDGACVISNEPFDWIECECADGSGFGGGGGMEWAGLSEPDLIMICEETVAMECGGPPPPPPGLECMNELGSCSISNDPVDDLACECTDGTEFGGGGGEEWAGLSDEELLMLCEQELNAGCEEGGETEGMTTGETSGGTDGETEGETEGQTSGGTEGETGIGGSEEGEGGSSGEEGGGTTGGGEGSEGGGSEGGADGEGDGGSTGGCSIGPRSGSAGWALGLLGLLGLRLRRRRAP